MDMYKSIWLKSAPNLPTVVLLKLQSKQMMLSSHNKDAAQVGLFPSLFWNYV